MNKAAQRFLNKVFMMKHFFNSEGIALACQESFGEAILDTIEMYGCAYIPYVGTIKPVFIKDTLRLSPACSHLYVPPKWELAFVPTPELSRIMYGFIQKMKKDGYNVVEAIDIATYGAIVPEEYQQLVEIAKQKIIDLNNAPVPIDDASIPVQIEGVDNGERKDS